MCSAVLWLDSCIVAAEAIDELEDALEILGNTLYTEF